MLHLFHCMTHSPLDRIDTRLVALLQEDNRRPLRQLADELGISAPTCLRRLRKLESQKVIVGHGARVDAVRLGFQVRAYIEVSLVNPSGSQMAQFERRMQRCANVMQCTELAGQIDYLLFVVARTMEELSSFTKQFLADDKQVRKFRSLVVLRQTKEQSRLPE